MTGRTIVLDSPAARALIGVAERGSVVRITPPTPTTNPPTGELMEATRPAVLTVEPVDLAAALVMTRPVEQRMAAFVDIARVYHRMLAARPGATKTQIREQARAFGLTLLHRLQGAVLADVDAWIEE